MLYTLLLEYDFFVFLQRLECSAPRPWLRGEYHHSWQVLSCHAGWIGMLWSITAKILAQADSVACSIWCPLLPCWCIFLIMHVTTLFAVDLRCLSVMMTSPSNFSTTAFGDKTAHISWAIIFFFICGYTFHALPQLFLQLLNPFFLFYYLYLWLTVLLRIVLFLFLFYFTSIKYFI